MVGALLLGLSALLPFLSQALRWSPEHVGYNLNENEEAIAPTDYWGEWDNHTFHPSPSNWRFPFYVLTLDRYIDGDPTNNEANGTVFEHNWMTNQFRFGGDVKGLQDNLDYIQGLGIKVNYRCDVPLLLLLLLTYIRLFISPAVHSSTCHGLGMDLGRWTLHCLIDTTETLRIGGQ